LHASIEAGNRIAAVSNFFKMIFEKFSIFWRIKFSEFFDFFSSIFIHVLEILEIFFNL
jgi:hypothetical protein